MSAAAMRPGAVNACDELIGPALRSGHGATPAVIHGERSLSYAELDALANRFGNALLGAGVARGDRVLFLLTDTPELVAGYLATMKVGAVAIALNTRIAAKDLRFVIEDSDAAALVVDAQFLAVAAEAATSAAHQPRVTVVAGDAPPGAATLAAFLAGESETLEATATAPDDMAFWIYTSGTTGAPKAAIHCHGDVLIGERHLVENLGVEPGDRIFSSSKLFFAFALGHCLLAGLRARATLVLFDGLPDTDAVARIIDRHRPAVVFSVPTFYRNLLRGGHAEGEGCRAVRHFVSAGERLPVSLFEAWQRATGRPILEGIGATEFIFLAIANTPAANRPGSTGRPMPWTELRLLDDEGRPVNEPGRPGILWVRMASLCAGYWGQEEKTAAAIADGWYRTGDVFTVDAEGWWYHEGRSDDLLKISGQMVSPTEIEDCALAAPGVSDAAVIGLPNADGLVRLAMFVVPGSAESREALAERLQEHIKARLSIYKCPRNITFVDEIPRTPTGKVQRFRLRELAAGGL